MNVDTVSLHCFLAVSDMGNITRAAALVGRTQSAVSQQIAKLENMVGKPLFNRPKKGTSLTLTPEGHQFLNYARKIFILHHALFDSFKQPELEGSLQFGLPEDFATVLLSEVLIEFTRIHPKVRLNVECDLTLNLFERFKRKEFDLVLVKMARPEDFPNGVEVWSETLNWVGINDSWEALLEENQPLPLVLSPHPCVYRKKAIEALEKTGLNSRLVYSSPSFAGTIAAVKAGLGITVLPKKMIPPELQSLTSLLLPHLTDTHVSLLRHESTNKIVDSLEKFVLKKLNH
jgi:DNA-binding transcriptional LysR family regulator